jgi:uncharacterized protein YbjT (DUF2867 family)
LLPAGTPFVRAKVTRCSSARTRSARRASLAARHSKASTSTAGSGAERKLTGDRDRAIKLLEAARTAGVERYVMMSAVGAENPPAGDEGFSVYLRAKADADTAVAASDRSWTIIRPGGLTNEPGTGSVRVCIDPYRGRVSRDDIAAVLAAVLAEPRLAGVTFYLNGGDVPIASAVAALVP